LSSEKKKKKKKKRKKKKKKKRRRKKKKRKKKRKKKKKRRRRRLRTVRPAERLARHRLRKQRSCTVEGGGMEAPLTTTGRLPCPPPVLSLSLCACFQRRATVPYTGEPIETAT